MCTRARLVLVTDRMVLGFLSTAVLGTQELYGEEGQKTASVKGKMDSTPVECRLTWAGSRTI